MYIETQAIAKYNIRFNIELITRGFFLSNNTNFGHLILKS